MLNINDYSMWLYTLPLSGVQGDGPRVLDVSS